MSKQPDDSKLIKFQTAFTLSKNEVHFNLLPPYRRPAPANRTALVHGKGAVAGELRAESVEFWQEAVPSLFNSLKRLSIREGVFLYPLYISCQKRIDTYRKVCYNQLEIKHRFNK